MTVKSQLVGSILLAAIALFAETPGRAEGLRSDVEAIVQDYIASHPDEIGKIARDYFIKHPEAFQEMFSGLLKRRNSPVSAPAVNSPTPVEKTAAVKRNSEKLFTSSHQVTLGNPEGNVTLVEFFDYNCGYCKRAVADMLDLIKRDPQVKVVLKEFPILGPGSVEAARVAVAVRMQDHGMKYLEFHRKLMSERGQVNQARAIEVASDVGFDVKRLELDLTSAEIETSLAESADLAQALGMTGTPSYVVGENVVVGAVGIAALADKVKAARK